MNVSETASIFEALQKGDARAAEQLFPLLYDELRKLAAHKMANEAPGHTLQATALVHEAWLRLARSEPEGREGRTHYVGAAAEATRRTLIERARRKHSLKRGAGAETLDWDQVDVAAT